MRKNKTFRNIVKVWGVVESSCWQSTAQEQAKVGLNEERSYKIFSVGIGARRRRGKLKHPFRFLDEIIPLGRHIII